MFSRWAMGRRGGLLLTASVVIVVIMIISFGLLYVTETGRISALNSSIGSQQTVINGGQSSITQLKQALSSLQNQVSTLQSNLQSQINTLQGNVSSYQTLVSLLKATISSDEARSARYRGSCHPTTRLSPR